MSAPEPKYPAVHVVKSSLPPYDATGYAYRVACRIAARMKVDTPEFKMPAHTGLANYTRPERPYPNLTMMPVGFLIHYVEGWAGSNGFQEDVMLQLLDRLNLRETAPSKAPVLSPVPVPSAAKSKVRKKPKAKTLKLVKGTDEYK